MGIIETIAGVAIKTFVAIVIFLVFGVVIARFFKQVKEEFGVNIRPKRKVKRATVETVDVRRIK